jgi:hypothetical protein
MDGKLPLVVHMPRGHKRFALKLIITFGGMLAGAVKLGESLPAGGLACFSVRLS